MILRPDSRTGLVEQLKALPAEKRRVVVLFGRHPNEGSINIAVRHHAEWEKHGAVGVWIPARWTPHGFWHEVLKRKKKHAWTPQEVDWSIRALGREIPKDHDLIAIIERSGIKAPVVNLHGGGPSSHSVEISVHPNAPRWLANGVKTALKGASKKFTMAHPSARNAESEHPLEVVVEHYFRGRKIRPNKATQEAQKLYESSSFGHGQIGAEYLTHHGTQRYDLAAFGNRFNGRFKILLRELARASGQRGE